MKLKKSQLFFEFPFVFLKKSFSLFKIFILLPPLGLPPEAATLVRPPSPAALHGEHYA
jgi:hypothetical protein